jgi:hypothetical protein
MKDRDARRKALMDRMQQGGTTGGFGIPMKPGLPLWSPDNGSHLIDIIPYYAGKNDPLVPEGGETFLLEIFSHRNAGVTEGMRICLQETYGQPCPICEDRRRLAREGADNDVIKSLTPSRYSRTLYNILCYDNREQEQKGIQIFSTSFFLLGQYLKEMAKRVDRPGVRTLDPYIPYWDLTDGRSIAFRKEGKADSTKYIGIRFEDRDYQLEEELMDKAYHLDECIIVPTYEDLQIWYYGSGEEAAAGLRSHRAAPEETGSFRKPKAAVDEEEREPAPRKKKSAGEGPECPSGYEFGKDVDEYKECKKCDEWDPCAAAHETMKRKSKEVEPIGDEEEPPRRKRQAEPEEEEPSRRKRQKADEEPEEEEPPRRKRAKAEEEEEEPPRRKRQAEPEEEEEPPRRKRHVEPEEEEDEPPRRKRAKAEEEEEEPPRKKRRRE